MPRSFPSNSVPEENYCNNKCSSHSDCKTNSDTCQYCCWWIGRGKVCSNKVGGLGCVTTNLSWWSKKGNQDATTKRKNDSFNDTLIEGDLEDFLNSFNATLSEDNLEDFLNATIF